MPKGVVSTTEKKMGSSYFRMKRSIVEGSFRGYLWESAGYYGEICVTGTSGRAVRSAVSTRYLPVVSVSSERVHLSPFRK